MFLETSVFKAPTLMVLQAALKAACAARTTSAYLPSALPPTTTVCAAWEANPSK